MKRRFPVVATLLVLAAVAIMIRLGLWQLDRLHQKEMLLRRYALASVDQVEAAFPATPAAAEAVLYRRSIVACDRVVAATWVSGTNAAGVSGLARAVDCTIPGGHTARVMLGWSRQPTSPDWRGGFVHGIIAPGPRLVADPPQAGLQPLSRPDPTNLPNNHLSYAVQWFLFAATALVIYAIALVARLRRP